MNSINSFFVRFLILMVAPSVGFTQSARLQPAQIYEGDITTLIVEYVNKIPSLYAIDTSTLEADFNVLSIDPRVFRIDEAGEISNRMQWKIQISPRRTGDLAIPSLKLGGKTTPTLTLRVDSQPDQLRHNEHVSVEIEANPQNPYVGQQTDITLRLVHNVVINDGRLFEPEAENVTIRRSGDELSYSMRVDGGSLDVIDRTIALFANTAGRLELSPANFRGNITSTFGNSNSRSINRYSESLQLQVREAPVEFTGQHWLPARLIELNQEWQGVDGKSVVGDSISRRLQVIATGLRAEIIPDDLLLAESDQYKIYADQAERRNSFVGKDHSAELNQFFEIVLTKPGSIDLPGLRLRWWDVEEDIEKMAVLPGLTINVVALESASQLADNSPLKSVAIMFAALTMLMAVYWCISDNRRGAKLLLRYRQQKILKSACFSKDASEARREVLRWANIKWPDDGIIGLHQISDRIKSPDLSAELKKLDRFLFSAETSDWQGEQLYCLLVQYQRQRYVGVVSEADRLPALYPR